MKRKYILFVFVVFLSLSKISVSSHPRTDEITGKGDTTEYINATFDDPNFGVAFVVRTGEIMSWTVPDESKNLTQEDMYYIVIDCAEKIFGKDSERYEINKEKFMKLIEEIKE